MDIERRRNRKDWFRLDSFLGWQGLYMYFHRTGINILALSGSILFMWLLHSTHILNLLVQLL